MFFQNHTNVKEEVQDPFGETYTTSCDASHSVYIKVEEVSDVEEEACPEEASDAEEEACPEEASEAEEEAGPEEASDAEEEAGPEEVSDAEEEENPMPVAIQEIKIEPEVRCTSLYVHCKK
jgi:hypothetical protein